MKTQLRENVTREVETLSQIKCRLITVKCYRASEHDGDEIYLKVDNKKIWPARPFAKIKPDEEFIVNLDIISDGRGFVRIDLWEKDFFSDDLLGFFQFASVGAKGKFSTDLTPCNKDNPARYVLTWEM